MAGIINTINVTISRSDAGFCFSCEGGNHSCGAAFAVSQYLGSLRLSFEIHESKLGMVIVTIVEGEYAGNYDVDLLDGKLVIYQDTH